MSDQHDDRHTAESNTHEEDVRRVLAGIEHDPYDEDGYVIDYLERWARDDDVNHGEFRGAVRRIVDAMAAARAPYESGSR